MSQPAIPFLVVVPDDDDHDPDFLYAVATAYAHSGLIISKHGQERDQMVFAFPAVVCSSFALELFLKFFLMIDLIERGDATQKVRFGHTIPALWALVTATHKTLIACMFRNPTGEPLTIGVESRVRLFEQALRGLGDQPFVQWRYVHELRTHELMSHGAISLVVDAFQQAARYTLKQRALGGNNKGESMPTDSEL